MMFYSKDYPVTEADVVQLVGAWWFIEDPRIQLTNQGTLQLPHKLNASMRC